MSDHGNPKEHPEVPHEHTWEYNNGNQKKLRRRDERLYNKNDEISIKIFAILLEMWTTIIGLLQILNVIQVTKR